MKKNTLALVSLILGALYVVYLIYYFTSGTTSTDAAEQVGAVLAGAIVMPHMICTAIAVIMNAIGYFTNMRGFILAGAILYIIAIVLMPVYFMFTIIQSILSFVAFAKMKKSSETTNV